MSNAFGRRSGSEQPRPPWGDEITPLTEVCGGRYVLLHEIARGDHSIVYRAKPSGGRDPVAFKVLQPRFVDDEASVRRFRREAELLRKIEHPNLVRLIDHGTIEDGRDFIALELLVGRTLADALENNRRMSPERTCRIVRQIARALRAMHQAGVIHRALQPENILLIGPEDGERVKLVDFAKAGDVGAPARRVKQSIHVESGGQGELDYRAPEQRRKRPPHPSMDVFSLGVIAYQMLSGEHPFAASSTESMPRLGPHTIRTKAFDAPEALLGLVADCIEREPESRPKSMDEVIEQLDKALLWMGVVPHGSAITKGSDEDARTQLYSAADGDRVEQPSPARGAPQPPKPQQPLLRERSPLMDELYEPIEEVLATEPQRPKARREAKPSTIDDMDAMPTARRRPEAATDGDEAPGESRPAEAQAEERRRAEAQAEERRRAEAQAEERRRAEAEERRRAEAEARRRAEAEAEAQRRRHAARAEDPPSRDRQARARSRDGDASANADDRSTFDPSPPPNLDTDELDAVGEGRALVVDTVAWTKPEPSAESKAPRPTRASRVETDSDETRRATIAPPQVLPRWLVPLLSVVLMVLAYAVWVVWTK